MTSEWSAFEIWFGRNLIAAICVTKKVENSDTSRSRVYVGAYFGIWMVFLLILRNLYRFDASEALTALFILGLIFPAFSLLATRHVTALPDTIVRPALETAVLAAYLAVIAAVLVWGFGSVARIRIEPLHTIVLLCLKLVTFVVVPSTMLLGSGRYRIRELVPISLSWTELRPAQWMSLAVLLIQSFLGRGLHDIRQAHLPIWMLAVAAPLSFAWLVIEVGVVEEFFFRALLQERLAAVLRSPWGGLAVAALLFGLVHAPGLYLRTTATQESIGLHPSLLMAVGYSIVMTSLAGLFVGVLWMRTKNLAVVVIVHAAGDFLPNLVPWIRAFHLAR
jgi:membrane protease YdiL (CAAX protease family)